LVLSFTQIQIQPLFHFCRLNKCWCLRTKYTYEQSQNLAFSLKNFMLLGVQVLQVENCCFAEFSKYQKDNCNSI
jgi:hypothetical protein